MQMGNPRPNLELVVVLYFDGSCDVEWSKNDSGCSNIAQSSDPASLQFSLSCSHPRALVAPATVAASMSLSATRMRIPAVTKASSPAQIIRSRSTVASTSASMLDAKSRVRDHARKISGSSVREATTTNSVYVALCCAHLSPTFSDSTSIAGQHQPQGTNSCPQETTFLTRRPLSRLMRKVPSITPLLECPVARFSTK